MMFLHFQLAKINIRRNANIVKGLGIYRFFMRYRVNEIYLLFVNYELSYY